MSQFALFATLTLEPGTKDAFMPLIQENAASSVADEPGCQRFDVLLPRKDDNENTVYLYECYDDKDAFAAHQATPHYTKFGDTGGAMIANMEVVMMTGR
jgi:quinol monooxygenase YgiN|tara:strand:- start:219 stop:515 length:297 start_codon:yes stop_codon:yes gene_type:complete